MGCIWPFSLRNMGYFSKCLKGYGILGNPLTGPQYLYFMLKSKIILSWIKPGYLYYLNMIHHRWLVFSGYWLASEDEKATKRRVTKLHVVNTDWTVSICPLGIMCILRLKNVIVWTIHDVKCLLGRGVGWALSLFSVFIYRVLLKDE